MSRKEKLFDKCRMAIWLVIGLALYLAANAIGTEHPQWQTVTYKMGHVTTLAWIGYWIDRNANTRVTEYSSTGRLNARAIIMAGVIIAGSLGL